MIDLHMHSIFSDGSCTPEELVEEARCLNLSAISLTDHDTIKGIDRFLKAANTTKVRPIPGVEISAEYPSGEMHILGYFIDPNHSKLNEKLEWIRSGRESRNQEILDKLNQLGLTLAWDEVSSFAGDEVVGRPHFAQALMARGYVSTKKEAFNKYLATGKPACAQRRQLSPEASLEVIRDAGGVPVLAHPFTVRLDPENFRQCLSDLCDQGLGGLEVYYSEHNEERVKIYLPYAKEFNLAPSGGSDFHGAMSPGIKMGHGFGSLEVPDELLGELESRSCSN
ncbi:MAG: PHP domain-containing protein [Kiritimatiellae bacterium]|nr:PHP domain-containing protein [Kiritimatiellia bacterium]